MCEEGRREVLGRDKKYENPKKSLLFNPRPSIGREKEGKYSDGIH